MTSPTRERASQLASDAITAAHPVAGQLVAVPLGQPPRTPRWWRAIPLVLLIPALAVLSMVTGGSTGNPSCATQSVTVFDGDLARILATIRTLESSGNYQAQATGSTASGAYQFLDASWANYAGYSRAWLAPPSVQDAKAAEWATAILHHHHGDVTTIPVTWYIGHVPPAASSEWDTVPFPDAGNALSPRQYRARWMDVYNDPAITASPVDASGGPTCVGVIGPGTFPGPAGVDQLVASRISWGGYRNGHIPYEAMRYSAHSGYLYPAASAAWEQLYAAALAAGYDPRGSGYRPASTGGETAGRSNHGWGLAIDITGLVPGNRYPTTSAAFSSDEYAWLTINAATFGWINPSWAKPATWGGTGSGGHVGDQCCFLEPWHWEWAAFLSVAVTHRPNRSA